MATVLDDLELTAAARLGAPEEPVEELLLPLPDYDETPLAGLVRAAKRGETEAWEAIIRAYRKTVYAAVRRRVKTEADADEVTQEVFLHAMRKLPQLKDPQALASWLRRMADRLAINFVTRNHTFVHFDDGGCEDRRVSRDEPFMEVTRREAQEAVWRGLEHLGPMDRQTLLAFYMEGKSLDEMSREFAVPLGTIKRRLHVARKRLAKYLATMTESFC